MKYLHMKHSEHRAKSAYFDCYKVSFMERNGQKLHISNASFTIVKKSISGL